MRLEAACTLRPTTASVPAARHFVARTLRQWKVDVVHSHDIYCNIFAVPWARMLSGCSIIASRRWWYEAPRPELVTVNRWTSRLAHRILANSSAVAELLAREEGVPRRKIVEIPNFLAENAFEAVDKAVRVAQRRRWGLPDGAFVIGIVARLSPVKNHRSAWVYAASLSRCSSLQPRSGLENGPHSQVCQACGA